MLKVRIGSCLPIVVSKINDRLGIDIIMGLTETEEGFCGLLTITEYITKYAHSFPIKSKSAKEIAMYLFKYISIFGPPKSIIYSLSTLKFKNC